MFVEHLHLSLVSNVPIESVLQYKFNEIIYQNFVYMIFLSAFVVSLRKAFELIKAFTA